MEKLAWPEAINKIASGGRRRLAGGIRRRPGGGRPAAAAGRVAGRVAAGRRQGGGKAAVSGQKTAWDKTTNHMLRQDPELNAWRRPQTHDQGWPQHVRGPSTYSTHLCIYTWAPGLDVVREMALHPASVALIPQRQATTANR